MKRNLLILLIILVKLSIAQNIYQFTLPLYRNFPPELYHNDAQVWSAIEDTTGVLYFGTSSGISIYDGNNWSNIFLDKVVRDFTQDSKGNIYYCSYNEFGIIKKQYNGLKFIALSNNIPKEFTPLKDIWRIEYINGFIVGYTSEKMFAFDLRDSTFYLSDAPKIFRIYRAGKTAYFIFVDGKIWTFDTEKKVFERLSSLENLIKKQTFASKEPDEVMFISQYKKDTFLIVDVKRNVYIWDGNNYIQKIGKIKRFLTYDLKKYQNYLINSTYGDGIFVYKIDTNRNATDTSAVKLLYHFGAKEGLISDVVYYSFINRNKNHWATTNHGISLIYTGLPFGSIDSRLGLNTESIYTIKRIDQNIFIAGSKIFQYNIINKKIKTIKAQYSQTWAIEKIKDKILIARNGGIYYLKNDTLEKTNFTGENAWFIVHYPNTDYYFVGTSLKLYVFKIRNLWNSVYFDTIEVFKNLTGDNRYYAFDKDNNFWIHSYGIGVFQIAYDKEKDTFYIKKAYDKNFFGRKEPKNIFYSKKLQQLFLLIDRKIYLLDTQKDMLIYDKRFLKIFPDEKVEFLGKDSTENLWFVSRKNTKEYIYMVKVDKDTLTKYTIYQTYSDILGVISKNIIAFPVGKAVLFFNTDELNVLNNNKFSPVITKIFLPLIDSTIGIYLNKNNFFPQINYNANTIEFHFSSNYYPLNEYNEFSYKLENFDKKWSAWTNIISKEYTNLPPGVYTFKLKTRNIFNQESKEIDFKFQILPPWYLTTAAFVLYFILFLVFLYGLNKFFTYNLKRRNERLEKIVKERTREIEEKNKILEKQKEEIELKNLELQRQKQEIELKNAELEQQKEEILTQAEELEIVNRELQKLSIIAQETDNAVILADKDGNFVWINPAFTKMFGYTFEELINEVSPNIISDSTDPYVKKQIERCLKEKVSVEYEMKARNKFNKEIWVHVTLTPILDDEGNITALIAVDSDITELKKAEEQIKLQNENIKSSIRYALTIQKSILPSEEKLNSIFETFVIFRPKDIVSGDFYWLSNIYDLDKMPVEKFSVGSYFFFAVADCTGHGVPGAFMSLIGSRLLSEIVHEHKNHKPSAVLYEMDDKLKEILNREKSKNPDGIVMSLCRFDKIEETKTPRINVTFAGAKSSIIYYKQKENKFHKIRSSARQIGFVLNENLEFFDQKFILEKDDIIFMYSDGLKDLNDPNRRSFGMQRAINIIKQNIDKPMKKIQQVLEQSIDKWLGGTDQRDDITFIGFRIK